MISNIIIFWFQCIKILIFPFCDIQKCIYPNNFQWYFSVDIQITRSYGMHLYRWRTNFANPVKLAGTQGDKKTLICCTSFCSFRRIALSTIRVVMVCWCYQIYNLQYEEILELCFPGFQQAGRHTGAQEGLKHKKQ